MSSDPLAEEMVEVMSAWYSDRDDAQDLTGAEYIARWLRSPEGREVVARELGLARPEDTLREAADEIEANYPPDVFIPPSKEQFARVNAALKAEGTSTTGMAAHMARHYCGVLRHMADRLTAEGTENQP